MVGLFKSPLFVDHQLGELCRKSGFWRGTVSLGGVSVPLVVHGPRVSPDPQALEIARTVAPSYPDWRLLIAAALFEHYAPYAEALAAADLEQPVEPLPRIARPEEVWPHASVAFVAVVPLAGRPGVEIGYRVAWDKDHALGARLRNGRLIELNGSVLPP
jgi:hypothetical protein